MQFSKLIFVLGMLLILAILVPELQEGEFQDRYGVVISADNNPLRFWSVVIAQALFLVLCVIFAWPEKRNSYLDSEYYLLKENAAESQKDTRDNNTKSTTNSGEQEKSICDWSANALSRQGIEISDSESEYIGTFHDAKYKGKLYMVGYVYYPPYMGSGKPTVTIMIRRYVRLLGSNISDKNVGEDDPFLFFLRRHSRDLERNFNVSVNFDC